jgi:phosphatidylglycerophosphatase C
VDHADHKTYSRTNFQKIEVVSRVIAFFDFDGTITSRDSLLEFIRYTKGDFSFFAGFALHAPVLVAYKLQIISNHKAKEIMLRHFFGKMPVGDFEQLCERFNRERLPGLIREKAVKEIRKLQAFGADVVVVSASPENWLVQWCRELGVECIATKMLVDNNRITGKIDGRNCHGEEKVRRIREKFDLDNYSAVYCYGDTPGDRYMLSLGNYRFYKPFR